MTKKSIESTYQSANDTREHILLRPSMYVDSVELLEQDMWICDENNDFIKQSIIFSPGLYKIFDEILVNARDHCYNNSSKCKNIWVNINESLIEIKNDGPGIPVVLHKKCKMLVPEMIFGKLYTSSNYDDDEKRLTGGMNGLGAKLTNIFSSKFIVETVHDDKKFYQEYYDNMSNRSDPKVSSKKGNSYTKISFIPDFKRFNLKNLSNDIISLFKKRVYDIAGTLNMKIKVYFNDEKIEINSFKQLIQKYMNSIIDESNSITEESSNIKLFYDDSSRWQIGVIFTQDYGFDQISYVNGICTYKGGTHVEYILSQIRKKISEQIAKKYKDIKLKPQQINEHMVVFINCLIENPIFSSQVKEELKLKTNQFGSIHSLSDKMTKGFLTSGILDYIGDLAKMKAAALLKKSDGKKTTRIRGINKLVDAEYAGTKHSEKCTLILCEGDSAKTFIMSGIKLLDRKYYGVFPLRGNVLNVRDASDKQLTNNEEIINIKQILGLKQDEDYTDKSQLRYGKILIMTDQDPDGSHIKGLIINFFHYFWPELLKNKFINYLATPLVTATNNNNLEIFYNSTDYEKWKDTHNTSKFKIKYYKGLASNNDKNGADLVFNDVDNKIVKFKFNEDNEEDDNNIDLAFNGTKANNRKKWLMKYDKNDILDNTNKKITFTNFINKDFIHFSNYNNQRSIPSLIDGFKPSQRKILYGAFLSKFKNEEDEVKVSIFASRVSEKTDYHHGPVSLEKAIISMAQDYVGSNNINLLKPHGIFGSRIAGGSDSGAPRYIFTSMSNITRKLFRSEDNPILNHIISEGIVIEPEFYIPILPMILINGCNGIGTGFSTTIPSFDPLDIIDNIYKLMENKNTKSMKPYYRGFKGTIERNGEKFTIRGKYIKKDNKVTITELPIGLWFNNYKDYLEKLVDNKVLKDFKDYYDDKNANFELIFNDEDDINDKILKISTTVSLSNMHLYNSNGIIQKYERISEILKEFYEIRILFYTKRKNYQLKEIENDCNILKYKILFIQNIINKKIIINNKSKQDIIDQLKDFPKIDLSYNYLLMMPIYSLSKEKIDELQDKLNEFIKLKEDIFNTSEIQMWKREIKEFIVEYNKYVSF